jgi:hypothetical protein
VRDDAVDAEHRKKDGDERERAKEQQIEAARRN